jgi:hypothetical protein
VSTLDDDLAAQLRHEPCVCEQVREPGEYFYCPQHWQGSVTRNAPGKTVLRGEDFDGLVAQESRPYRPNEALRAAAAKARTVVRHRS